jgi:predicted nucleotidyltransferase
MQAIIDARRKEIAELCRRFHVRRLDLFGSASQGAFDPSRSDVDLLVEFGPSEELKALDQYFGLKEALKEALEELLDRPVDLVVSSAVTNPYIRKSIEETRESLYAA